MFYKKPKQITNKIKTSVCKAIIVIHDHTTTQVKLVF